ncbi:MAG: D-amino-acid transaminase [Thermoanaerobacteraceae bacterium]|nr:D-amino-acid transaminase [Thermoanaerobacteraceae bacterium]
MPELTYLNGEIFEAGEASISTNDRGFIFGDGVYEVVRSYNGKLFGLEEHLQRLQQSADAIELKLPHTIAGFKELIETLNNKSKLPNTLVYIQVTRGTEPRNHLFSLDLKPNVLITIRTLPAIPEEIYTNGISTITVHDGRWDRCHVKSISLLGNILAKHEARKQGVFEAIFVREDSTVTEASTSNVFMVSDGVLHTHPANNRILNGITRQFVLGLSEQLDINVAVQPFTRKKLLQADEVFLTNSVQEVIPVVTVDGVTIGNGKPGTITNRLMKAYRQLAAQGGLQ